MPDQEREKYLKEISSLHAENATLKEEMALMQSQLDWLKKQMFGRKTEQSTVILEGGEQLSFRPDEKAVSDIIGHRSCKCKRSVLSGQSFTGQRDCRQVFRHQLFLAPYDSGRTLRLVHYLCIRPCLLYFQ